MADALREHPVETPELQKDRQLLAQTRARRWKALRATFPPVRIEITEWALRMEAQYGRVVMVWENVIGWVTALYIARYGENEAYWPDQLSDDDVRRAAEWERDASKTPKGVRYLMEG